MVEVAYAEVVAWVVEDALLVGGRDIVAVDTGHLVTGINLPGRCSLFSQKLQHVCLCAGPSSFISSCSKYETDHVLGTTKL